MSKVARNARTVARSRNVLHEVIATDVRRLAFARRQAR